MRRCQLSFLRGVSWDKPQPEEVIGKGLYYGTKMKYTFYSSRNCIGKMFSMQEMRLCLSTLIKHFDFKPIAECMEDTKDRRQFVTLNIAKNTFKVKMSLRH